MSDAINPDHYKRLPAEAIEIIEAMIAGAPDNKAAYLHGQAAKYDLRLWRKGKSLEDYLADLGKHIWYALRLESHLLELIEKQKTDEQPEATVEVAGEVTTEVTVEVTGEVKNPLGCPDGWRFLEEGEVIRKGDVWLEKGQIHSLGLLMLGQTCQTHWKPIIRRNRFEVGEKVIGGLDGFEFVVVGKHSRFNDVYVVRNKITGTIHNILDRLLTPYIEETK